MDGYITSIPFNENDWQNIGVIISEGFGSITNYLLIRNINEYTISFTSGTVSAQEAWIRLIDKEKNKYTEIRLGVLCSSSFTSNTKYTFKIVK